MSVSPPSTPPSLAELFKAPNGYRGHFGYVCGYSADSGFLQTALERFTRYTAAQRAAEGRLSVVLMLDPAHPQIAFTAVPGLYHAPFRRDIAKPFRLMHAKVALLGFRHEKEPEKWMLRLVVSTGNWTRQTVEDSLDLAWHVSVASEALHGRPGPHVRQACADIAAAWGIMQILLNWYAQGVLAGQSGPEDIAAWLQEVSGRVGRQKPRFVDNRRESLLSQLLAKVPKGSGGWMPNWLALGSGFYEEGAANQVPKVLDDLVSGLQKARVIHRDADISVYVNPQACQAVARCHKGIVDRGWTVRAAATPEVLGPVARQLHAKFVFAAHWRRSSNSCHNAWLYLGSGNLTGPGFCQPAGAAGNLEAGVVLQPEGLYWEPRRGVPVSSVIKNVLPIHWDTCIALKADLQTGPGMPERGPDFVNAPVDFFRWQEREEPQGGALIPVGMSESILEVMGPDGLPCRQASGSVYAWTGQRPRQVEVRWQGQSAFVPVVDALGRVAADALPSLQIDQALSQLATFPDPAPDDDDPPASDDDTGPGGGPAPGGSVRPRRNHAAPYPFRQMMELLETIAARQTALTASEWPFWCARLEQTLVQAAEADVVGYFRTLGLNPLSILRTAPFRPDFSLESRVAGQRYEDVLDRAEAAWRVAGLAPLGDQ